MSVMMTPFCVLSLQLTDDCTFLSISERKTRLYHLLNCHVNIKSINLHEKGKNEMTYLGHRRSRVLSYLLEQVQCSRRIKWSKPYWVGFVQRARENANAHTEHGDILWKMITDLKLEEKEY